MDSISGMEKLFETVSLGDSTIYSNVMKMILLLPVDDFKNNLRNCISNMYQKECTDLVVTSLIKSCGNFHSCPAYDLLRASILLSCFTTDTLIKNMPHIKNHNVTTREYINSIMELIYVIGIVIESYFNQTNPSYKIFCDPYIKWEFQNERNPLEKNIVKCATLPNANSQYIYLLSNTFRDIVNKTYDISRLREAYFGPIIKYKSEFLSAIHTLNRTCSLWTVEQYLVSCVVFNINDISLADFVISQ